LIRGLKDLLKERNDRATIEIKKLIKEKSGYDFTQKHVRTILRSLGLKFGKPCPHDYRRPANAEEQFKKK